MGAYNIPANYSGSAFKTEDIKTEAPLSEELNSIGSSASEAVNESASACVSEPCTDSLPPSLHGKKERGAQKESLFRTLLSRFERGFEFDDLILLGLILLILQGENDCNKNSKDEIILILGFLFLAGF